MSYLIQSNYSKGQVKVIHKIDGNDKHLNNIHPDLDCNDFNELFAYLSTNISNFDGKDYLKWKTTQLNVGYPESN